MTNNLQPNTRQTLTYKMCPLQNKAIKNIYKIKRRRQTQQQQKQTLSSRTVQNYRSVMEQNGVFCNHKIIQSYNSNCNSTLTSRKQLLKNILTSEHVTHESYSNLTCIISSVPVYTAYCTVLVY